MKLKSKIFILFASIFLFYSCGTYRINKTSDFEKISDWKKLEGSYLAKSEVSKKYKNQTTLLRMFSNLKEVADFVTIDFETPKKVRLTYLLETTEGIIKKESVFEGERKGKFFEIYFSKQQFFIPLLYSNVNIARIRVGQDKNGDLLIKNFYDRSGNILFFGAGGSAEFTYRFVKSNQYSGLFPINVNEKWGFSNANKEIVITPKYDFVYLFNHNSAKVKKGGKWGLINQIGEEITPLVYDTINLLYIHQKTPVYFVDKDNKKGILDTLGNVILPVIYDEIDRLYEPQLRIRIGDKYGLATKEKLLVPAIYSEVQWFRSNDYVEVTRNNKIYLLDKEGFEYQTELYSTKEYLLNSQNSKYKPILATKRRVNFDEQF